MTAGRRKPYTRVGLRRLKCIRCGKPARQQWSICADDNLQRPICNDCDVELNALVLEWMRFPDWRAMITRYKEGIGD